MFYREIICFSTGRIRDGSYVAKASAMVKTSLKNIEIFRTHEENKFKN